MAHDGTGTGWDITAPANADNLPDGAKEIRDLRKGLGIRLDKEHVTSAASSAGGEHKAGSAVAYYQSSAPTQRPDASTTLTAADNGRLFVDSDDKILYVYVHGSGFVQVAADVPALSIATGDIANAAVTADKIAAAIAGDGLAGGAGTALSVNVDASTIEINADTLRVKDAGITLAKLASGLVRGKHAILADVKAAATEGGTATTGSWTARDINTEVFDEGNIVTIAANQFTLAAGTYVIHAASSFLTAGNVKLRLRNVTDGSTTVNGMSTQPMGLVSLEGAFTIAGSKTFELQYYASFSDATSDLGKAVNAGEDEVYTQIQLLKLS